MTIKKGTSTIATAGASEWGSIEGTLSDQTDLQNALNAKASTLSPSFTGAPTAPTAEEGTNTTQIATTAFVTTALNNIDALPDQTDMAGKYLATDGINAYWRSPSGLPLLSFLWSDHLLNDASFLRADTFSWQSGGVYKSVYEHLVDDFDNGIIGCSDTDGGVTVFYRLCPDGHKVCLEDQEQNVIDYYNANGVAWYYILDTVNQKFKLPRTKYGFTGLRDTVGNYVPESLPNIKGRFGGCDDKGDTTGAFYRDGFSGSTASGSGDDDPITYFDASRSSSAYQDNAPVQQRATQMYLYFYAGNTIRNETEIDVGEITEALNEKLDQDLSNASANFKETIVGWGMPDYDSGITVPISNSGTVYTPTENGILKICHTSGDGGNYCNVYFGEDNTGIMIQRWDAASQFNTGIQFMDVPVLKGQTYYIETNAYNRYPTTFYQYIGG